MNTNPTPKSGVPDFGHKTSKERLVFDPNQSEPVTGRIVGKGLAGEHEDRQYVVLEGTDGRAHYADLGAPGEDGSPTPGAVVEITARKAEIDPLDRQILTGCRGGERWWSAEGARHQSGFTLGTEEIEARKARLAQLEQQGYVKPQGPGIQEIKQGTVQRLEQEAQRRAQREPVVVRTLSRIPLERQITYPGPTWLDRQLANEIPAPSPGSSGFGGEVREVLRQRAAALERSGLAMHNESGRWAFRNRLLERLRRQELDRAGQSKERRACPVFL